MNSRKTFHYFYIYRSLRASRSHSIKDKISPWTSKEDADTNGRKTMSVKRKIHPSFTIEINIHGSAAACCAHYVHSSSIARFAATSHRTHLTNRTLDVSNDGTVGIVQELYANLGHISRVTSAAQHLVHLCQLYCTVLHCRNIICNRGNTWNWSKQSKLLFRPANSREPQVFPTPNVVRACSDGHRSFFRFFCGRGKMALILSHWNDLT